MIKKAYFTAMMALTVLGTALSFATPAAAAAPCTDQFLGINAWYKGLQDPANNCSVVMKADGTSDDVRIFVTTIALNILQAGLAIVAYVTVFFIIKGGFMYMTSAGSQDGMASAKKTITNAIIGLVIAVFAASVVNAIAGAIK
ncbi:hypothetical protein B7Z00_05225 [Candidatus Saccharibacteria bacterium 32-50-10]|nr:MAG: hypothetical protein B7Z00_05225 [Candidatus Saccharibacteria bacterium 32-50-10]